MANIYTPGLTISENIFIRKERRLPIKGEVFVKKGDFVKHDDIIAAAEIPGILYTVKAASILGIPSNEITKAALLPIGTDIKKGDIIAKHKAFFGLIKSECKSPYSGTLEMISEVTGNMGIRLTSTKIQLNAYIDGIVAEELNGDGIVIESFGSLIQGIFGIGGEKHGIMKVLAKSPHDIISHEEINSSHRGAILVVGASISIELIRKANALGVVGIVAGAMPDQNIQKYLGYDIGVTITGEESVNTSILLTEGFGSIPISSRTFELLQALDGKPASINGTTHIRAGVLRPEIISTSQENIPKTKQSDYNLTVGRKIRITSEPYFCEIAIVTELPNQPEKIPTEAKSRILYAKLLKNGKIVQIPRSNIEIIQD